MNRARGNIKSVSMPVQHGFACVDSAEFWSLIDTNKIHRRPTNFAHDDTITAIGLDPSTSRVC